MASPKKILFVGLKVVISFGLIAWLLKNANLSNIWHHVTASNVPLLIIAFLFFYIGYVCSAHRVRILLAAIGIKGSIWFLVKSFAVGVFFSNFLPSTIGGDFSRMVDLFKIGANKIQAVSLIFIDRFLGMLGLMCIGFVASLFTPVMRAAIPGIVWYYLLLVVMLVTLLLLIFGLGHDLVAWVGRQPNAILQFGWRIFDKIASSLSLIKGRYDIVAKNLLLSLILHINVVIHHYLVARAMNIDIGVWPFFVIVPFVVLSLLIPLSINGIGIRETVFVFLLGLYGIDHDAAVAYGFVCFFLVVLQGVVGGITFLLRGGGMPKPIDSIAAEAATASDMPDGGPRNKV